MKPLRAFAAGMLVGALTTFGLCLAWQPSRGADHSELAAFVASARHAVGRFAAAFDALLAPSPSSWTMRRPVESRLRMLRTGVVLTHRIIPEGPGAVAVSSPQNPVPGQDALAVNVSAAADPAPAPMPSAVDASAPSAPPAGQNAPVATAAAPSGAGAEPALAISSSQKPRSPAVASVKTASAPKVAPERAYARALQAYESGRQEEARGLFAAFLNDFPGHGLAPNAVYWTGETWYAQARYDKAAEAFARVLRDYPRHAKSPDALLKLAYTAMRLGRPDEARQYLDQLQARYPGSGASRLGRQARGRLEGRGRSGTMVATHG